MDKKNIDFHLEVDDYFGTLATVLDLFRQELERGCALRGDSMSFLERTRDDLVYLQNFYKIVRK